MFGFLRPKPARRDTHPPFLTVQDPVTGNMRLAFRDDEPDLYWQAYRETVRAFPTMSEDRE